MAKIDIINEINAAGIEGVSIPQDTKLNVSTLDLVLDGIKSVGLKKDLEEQATTITEQSAKVIELSQSNEALVAENNNLKNDVDSAGQNIEDLNRRLELSEKTGGPAIKTVEIKGATYAPKFGTTFQGKQHSVDDIVGNEVLAEALFEAIPALFEEV